MLVSVIAATSNSGAFILRHYHAVSEVLDREGFRYEILYVDDGSDDESVRLIQELCSQHPEVRGFLLESSCGQEAAISVGIQHFDGDVCMTLDVDLEVPESVIPDLVKTILSGNDYVLVNRVTRKPRSVLRSIGSIMFNRYMRLRTGLPIKDFGCGAGAITREVGLKMRASTLPHFGLKHLEAQLASSITNLPVNEVSNGEARSSYNFFRLVRAFLMEHRVVNGLRVPASVEITMTAPAGARKDAS